MWMPDEPLKIAPANFKKNGKALFIDKSGEKHRCTILDVYFKGLNTGYVYAIELDEPLNGSTKFLAKENKLTYVPRKTKNE